MTALLAKRAPSHFVTPSLTVVFVETHSTGRHAGTDVIGLHEAILARQRVEAAGESLVIESAWHEHIKRVQERESVAVEYNRLVLKYGKALVVSIYGELHTGRLKSVADRILKAYERDIPVKDIIELGRPENDGLEFIETDKPVANGIVKPGETAPPQTPHDPDSHKPSASDVTADIDENVPGALGGEDTPESAAINGALVAFLAELGWNEPDSMAVARLVRDHGIKDIPDADLKALRSFQKPDARKTIRQHLLEFTAQPAAPAAG